MNQFPRDPQKSGTVAVPIAAAAIQRRGQNAMSRNAIK
jgi:hypothetical protein